MSDNIDVIVLGSSPTGLYAAREASQAGLKVAMLDMASGCALHSRHVSRGEIVGAGDLMGWLEAHSVIDTTLIIPTSDVWIEALMLTASDARFRAKVLPAYQGLAGVLLDKRRFHQLCGDHGMETPGVWMAQGSDELAALSLQIPYPCILKPALIHRARKFLRGKKVLLARSRAEFVQHVESMPDGPGGWLVQEVIPGPESEITLFGGYIARDGTPMQIFTGRKLRQYPAGFGSASLVTSVPCPETRETTLDFLGRIGFRGICGAEYKRDPRDGRLKIIEINPRPTLWFQATHEAGCRVLEAAWRDTAGLDPLPERPQLDCVRWRYLLKDLASAVFYLRESDFVFPEPEVLGMRAARLRSWPVFRVDDPVPALAEPLVFLKKALGRRQ